MALPPGAVLGPYHILALVGVGGMGEVYAARDSKLGRSVALKLLPERFSSDPERLHRLKREAQVLASLNHPNIATIFGFEEPDGVPALVLELVEGLTLADRIAEGPIAVDEALAIALQIARALEAAHEQRIVHRDLKPSNIKVRPDGTVKVLDFGLAKAFDPVAAGDGVADRTLTMPMDGVVGTAAYMSPEQASGQSADKRTDIWAFGCVLYEMLTGTRAFAGADVSGTIAAVLGSEPEWARLPAGLRPALLTYLRCCLRKDPRQRVRDIGDVRLALEGTFDLAAETTPGDTARLESGAWRRHALAWSVASLAALIAIAAVIWGLSKPAAAPHPVRFDVLPPQGARFAYAGHPLSPDGRTVAYVMTVDGTSAIWVQPLDSPTAHKLPGTEDATNLFWSPDSKNIGFFARGNLKRIGLTGAPALVICNESEGNGSWNQDDVILIGGQRVHGPLLRVSAAGGQPTPATTLEQEGFWHDAPYFLPDGRHFLYSVRPGFDVARPVEVYVGVLGSNERRLLPGIRRSAQYSATGHVLFIRGATLMAQRFDASRLELSGEAFPVVEVGLDAPNEFAVSAEGSLAFLATYHGESELAWFDRRGKLLGVVAPKGQYQNPELSPDGAYVAFGRGAPPDLWVRDIKSGREERLTSHAAADAAPIWSPNGKTIAFGTYRNGPSHLYAVSVGVVGTDWALLKNDMPKAPADWSRDGRYLIFQSDDAGRDVWMLPGPLSDSTNPQRVTATPFTERNPRISPDGRWIAYASDESGRMYGPNGQGQSDVYVQSFPQPGIKLKVSIAGGQTPRWSHDGREIYYIAPDFTLMAVSFRPTAASPGVGIPARLFPTRIVPFGGLGRNYNVASDGRFLINVTPVDQIATPITVMLNWLSGVER